PVAWEVDTWLRELGEELSPSVLEPMNAALAQAGRAVTAAQWLSALAEVQRWARGAAALWATGLDVLLTPALPAPPAPLGDLGPAARPPGTDHGRRGHCRLHSSFHSHRSARDLTTAALEQRGTADRRTVRRREDAPIRLAAQLEQGEP